MPGKILIIDDIATNRIVLKVKLASAFYNVDQAKSGVEGLKAVERFQPDLIVISSTLSDMDAIEFCGHLNKLPKTASIPIVSVASECTPAKRIAALAAGINDILTKPFSDHLLLSRLRSLLRNRDTAEEIRIRDATNCVLGFAEESDRFEHPAKVVFVGADPADFSLWKSRLGDNSRHFLMGAELTDTLRNISKENVPDAYVILLGARNAELGLRLMADIRAQSRTRHAAIIAVLENEDQKLAADALDLGANDIMPSQRGSKELSLRIDAQLKRKRMSDKLRASLRDGLRASVIDPLTGLYNRRYAMPHLTRMSTDADNTGGRYTVMLADLDHFKRVNDTHGHAVGDQVLVAVANKLRENLREEDMIARIGGEEFLIVMPDTDRQEARRAARRLCRIIGEMPVRIANRKNPVHVTISIGVAVNSIGPATKALNVDALLDQADRALYGAKTDGRNQFSISAQPAA